MADSVSIARPLSIRQSGFNEAWLGEKIIGDPAALGLGELEVVSRQRRQSSGGRLDLLLKNPEDDAMYEVELMLGKTDESHIVRTLEYWDAEKRRWPQRQHYAVLVAETITRRFFNVIQLLSHAAPIIAIQATLVEANGGKALHFVKVLDVYEEAEVEVATAESSDRKYWESRSNAESLSAADKIVEIIGSSGSSPRVAYNKGHIAIGTTGYNFCWLWPRKEAAHCVVEIWPEQPRDSELARLRDAGLDASPRGSDGIRLRATSADCDRHRDVLKALLAECEVAARR